MHDNTYIQAQHQLSRYLKQTGKRQSMERNQVLSRFCDELRPWTAAELVQSLEKEQISRATVYNALHTLLDAEVIRLLPEQTTAHEKHYELARQRNEMRFVCTRCHRTAELKDKAVTDLISHKKISNFRFTGYLLTIYGECKVCRKTKTTKR